VSFATIDDLRSQLGARAVPALSDAYAAKMLHQIPAAPVVDRETFILEHCEGKRVLEFGASGPLHEAIMKAASAYAGVDRQDGPSVVGFDLDDVTQQTLPDPVSPEVVVCGELIEHLSNPGWFLTRLRRQFAGIPTIITVPNAFSRAAQAQLAKGIENVNIDHTCWFSFRTLKTLLGRAGYTDFSFAWYKGQPLTAEGLVVLCEGPR
jgi:hypothetical protein